jgi:O-succinylbenzoate synthase
VGFVFDIPLATRFRGIRRRRGLVWRGEAGWGEFSPFEDYAPADCVPWLRAAREAADQGFPPPVRSTVPVNATVPAVGPVEAAALVEAAGGVRTVKVKVAEPGQTADQEADRLAAVREALGPGGLIRIDANGAWDQDTAVERIKRLDRAAGGLEYVEQPCAATDDLAAVRRRVATPIAADESIRLAADPLEVVRLEAADIAVLKVQPLGGVRACLNLAAELGLPAVVSSAVETSIGLSLGVALAAALPRLDHACGLGTAQLLAGDLAVPGCRVQDGGLAVGRVSPDPQALARWAPSQATRTRWLERLGQVAALADAA